MVAQTAGRQYPSGRDVSIRHGLGVRLLRRLPTGYGLYQLSTEGVPSQLYDTQIASGFTHFQQSGTGAIRKYYNYFRVTPMEEPLDNLGNTWQLLDEQAEPGHYATTLSSGIRCKLTVGTKSAVHRYTFPAHKDARLVIDFSWAGWPFRTVPPCRSAHTLSPSRPAWLRRISLWRVPRWQCTWSVTQATGDSCCGTTAV